MAPGGGGAPLANAPSASSNAPASQALPSSESEEDVVLVDTRSFADITDRRLLTPADAEIASDLKRSPATAAFESDGRIYALPIWADVRVLVYNPAHLAQAGLPPAAPASLGDLRQQAIIVRRKGLTQSPYYALWTDEGVAQEFITWLGAYGGLAFDRGGRPVFMQEPGKKALQFMVSLAESGLISRDTASDEHQSWKAITQGGYTFGACWLGDLDALPGPYSIALLPVSRDIYSLERTFATSLAVYKGLGVATSSAHPKEAWRLTAFLAASLKSPRLDGLTEPSSKFDPVQAIGRIAFTQAQPVLSIPNRARAVAILARHIRAAVDKTATVENALNQAAREILELRGGPAPSGPAPQHQTNAPPASAPAPSSQPANAPDTM